MISTTAKRDHIAQLGYPLEDVILFEASLEDDLRQFIEHLALSTAEYYKICKTLERTPQPTELGMFGAMWTEHSGYAHSKELLVVFDVG